MDLSLVPIKELMQELKNRAETHVVILKIKGNDEYKSTYKQWHGEPTKAMGFCMEIVQDIYKWANDPPEEEKDEPDETD